MNDYRYNSTDADPGKAAELAFLTTTLVCNMYPVPATAVIRALSARARRSRHMSVIVMQATEYRESNYRPALTRRSGFLWLGNLLLDTLMRPRAVEVPGILVEDAPQVGFAHDQHVIEALTADAAKQSFADGILLARQQHLVRRMEHNSSR